MEKVLFQLIPLFFDETIIGGAQYPYNSNGSSRPADSSAAAASKSKGRIAAPPTRVKAVQRSGSSTNTSEPRTKIASQPTPPASAPAATLSSDDNNSALTQALETVSHLQSEIERLQTVNDELQTDMSGIEKERDFYFDKLRDIEMMLQDIEDSGKGNHHGDCHERNFVGNELTAKIFEILYATAEGFQPAEDVAREDVMEPSNEAEEDETY